MKDECIHKLVNMIKEGAGYGLSECNACHQEFIHVWGGNRVPIYDLRTIQQRIAENQKVIDSYNLMLRELDNPLKH